MKKRMRILKSTQANIFQTEISYLNKKQKQSTLQMKSWAWWSTATSQRTQLIHFETQDSSSTFDINSLLTNPLESMSAQHQLRSSLINSLTCWCETLMTCQWNKQIKLSLLEYQKILNKFLKICSFLKRSREIMNFVTSWISKYLIKLLMLGNMSISLKTS